MLKWLTGIVRTDTVGGGPRCHEVQLFDHGESLAEAVTSFLLEGVRNGDALLVVMRSELWNRTAASLPRAEFSLAEAMASGRLTVEDSGHLLRRFMVDGMPSGAHFDDVVGGFVRRLNSRCGRLRIYGDMVDILAASGEFGAAHQLEELWNRLNEREPFTLFCGYSSAHFADPRSAGVLRAICRSHSHVHSGPDDLLAASLVDRHVALPSRPA
jgi:hypothetical protein